MKPKPFRKPNGFSRLLLASVLLAAANSAQAQSTYYWDADGDATTDTGGPGNWDTASSLWRNGSATGTLSQWPNTDPAVDYAQMEGTAGTVTLNSDSVNLNVNRITFGTTGYEIKGPVSGTASVNLSGTSPQISTGTSISATISANISGSTGFSKTGAGTLTLKGANTYSGTTSVSAGSITVEGNHSGGGGWTINNSAAATSVTFATGSTISVGAGNNVGTANGGGTAARAIVVAGAVTTSSTSNVSIYGRNSISINNGGSWDMQGGTLTVQPLNSGYGATLTVNSGGSFTYSGTKTIIVSEATTGNAGSGTLNLRGTFTTTTGFSNSGAGTGTGTSNFNFLGGTLKISNDIAAIFAQGSQPFNITTGTGGGTIDTNGFNTATSLGISGTGGLTKAGDGTLTLSGTNTYAGDTSVTGGTLALAVDNISNDTSRVTIGGTGILKLTFAGTDTVQRLTVNGNRMPNGVYGYNSTDSIAQSINSYFEATGTGTLTVTDAVAPTLPATNIVDDKSGGPVTANTLVTYTVTFSEEMNASTISAADFGNAGNATCTIGTVTQVSPSVFQVPVTPTSAGTLQLSVIAGADIKDFVNNPLDTTFAITDDTIVTVNAESTGYGSWSGGAPADGDANNDGVENAVAWVLGAANTAENAIGLLPTLDNTSDPNYVIFTFQRSDLANADPNTAITVQYSSNLADWTTAVDDNNNVEIQETDGSPKDTVVVKLKRSTLGASGKLLARLKVVMTP